MSTRCPVCGRQTPTLWDGAVRRILAHARFTFWLRTMLVCEGSRQEVAR